MTTQLRGHVAALFTAQAAGEPVQSREAIEVVPGIGIPGDRYATGQGHWSDPRWPDQQITLVEAELAQALGLALGDLRRNIVTRHVDLVGLIGVTFTIGAVTLQGVRTCDPCRYIETLTRPRLFEELAGRGGLRAAILEPGSIHLGDTISPVELHQ